MPRMISIQDLGPYPTDTEESSGWRDDAYLQGIQNRGKTRRPKVREETEEDHDEETDTDQE